MNILVTGATGVIGRQAIPRLLQAGHEVAGLARSAVGARWLRAAGATPVHLGDDAPVTALQCTAWLAAALDAQRRRRLPVWAARRLLGGMADLLAVSQRICNQAFRQAASWEPRYRSVEAGWPTAVSEHRRSA